MVMKEQLIREHIIRAFESTYVDGLHSESLRSKILDPENNINMADLGLDSLSIMEICISIELNTSITIVPHEFIEMKTTNSLVGVMMSRIE